MLSLLGTTATSVEQGREHAAGSNAPPGRSSGALPRYPAQTHTHTREGVPPLDTGHTQTA